LNREKEQLQSVNHFSSINHSNPAMEKISFRVFVQALFMHNSLEYNNIY